MANPEQLERLKQGVEGWNKWRERHPNEPVDLDGAKLTSAVLTQAYLTEANLTRANLSEAYITEARLSRAILAEANLSVANLTRAYLNAADLTRANLTKADLAGATLEGANLSGANLTKANVSGANLERANLSGANLTKANLMKVNLRGATLWQTDLARANLRQAHLRRADLTRANLTEASLMGAYLRQANLTKANLRGAGFKGANLMNARLAGVDLRQADISRAILVEADLEDADLAGCHVYGVSAWDVHLAGAIQTGLVITPEDTAEITVDNLQVAQFIYLLLNNENIRHVIDTITSKVVLILGRFTPERKAVLDALRDTLRTKNYSPVVFDFEKSASRNLTETIRVLAGMARFVIADITDAKSIPQELMAIVPDLPSVPAQPLLLASQQEYGMFEHFRSYPWVLKEQLYDDPAQLVRSVESAVIAPPELWLEEKRAKA